MVKPRRRRGRAPKTTPRIGGDRQCFDFACEVLSSFTESRSSETNKRHFVAVDPTPWTLASLLGCDLVVSECLLVQKRPRTTTANLTFKRTTRGTRRTAQLGLHPTTRAFVQKRRQTKT